MNKVRLLRHILTPTLLVILLSGCSGGRQYRALLEQADSLMAVQPDSAYALLSAIDSADLQRQRQNVRMRYELLHAEAQNKLYIPFRTDSVLREVADYYKRCGSNNQQLKARYLLGCAYRDLHEAPIALLTWEEAIAAADTTAADCDYATLFRVYGQMAEIYFRQYMPEKHLESQQKYCEYALLAGDTLNYIRGLLSRNDAFLSLRDTSAVLENIKLVRKMYQVRGLIQEAARVYPSAIHIALDRGKYEKADSMMQIFQNESGLFDSLGNIAPTYEIYYYRKGIYYLGVHKLDSAELQFRRLLPHEPNLVDAYRGLLAIYEQRNDADSISKYSREYENELAHYIRQTKTTAVTQSEGLYNYSRHEKLAQQERVKSERNKWLSIIIVSFCVTILIVMRQRHKKRQEQKDVEIRSLMLKMMYAKDEVAVREEEISLLKEKLLEVEGYSNILQKKEAELEQWREKTKGYEKELSIKKVPEKMSAIQKSEIVQLFHSISEMRTNRHGTQLTLVQPRAASTKEWEALERMVEQCAPSFYSLITKDLTVQEMRICMLLRLGFKEAAIANLLGTSPSRVSNAKKSSNKKLFNELQANTLLKNLSKRIL